MITCEDGSKKPGKFAHMVEAAKCKKEALAKDADIAVAVATAHAAAEAQAKASADATLMGRLFG